MGGGGKGGSTTTSSVQIPPEVLARYNAVNAQAQTAAQQPYQEYSKDPNAFVQPLTATQQAGIQNTNAMAGAAQPYYGTAAGLAAAGTQNVDPSALNVGQYYNPFTQAVAAPTLQALQQQQATERSNLVNPQTAASFGGDRSGVVAANLARQQALGTAQAMNPIYQQGYQQALTTAQQQQGVGLGAAQANRANLQQSAQLLGQLGTGAQAAGLAGAQAQLGAGQVEQQTGQAGLQALYNQFQQKQGYPFQVAQFLANIAEGTGALSGNTTTSTTTGGGGFFSDERLKENIQKVGKTNDGQPIYRYNYKGDPRTQIGLLAQEVEKDHPDAVGLAGGYKTVNYKKATEDAVKKADGGTVSDDQNKLGAYSMDAPSAMLSKPMIGQNVVAGLGTAPMVTGNIPIHPGATNPEAAGILAPKATGVSPGSVEGAQAELASLQGGKPAWSGQGYQDLRTKQLQDFLAANSSQGGLVGPQGGGTFARGGMADGRYMNPALQYYAPQGGVGGLYGVQLQPGGGHQLVPAQAARAPQQKDGIASATQMAGLVGSGNAAWQARPDFLRSAADIAARKQTADALKATELQKIQWAKDNGYDLGTNVTPSESSSVPNMGTLGDAPLPTPRPDDFASGGLAGGRQHYANLGYVDPGSGPYGGSGDYLSGILADQAKQPQYHEMKGGEMPRQQPQQSGLGALSQMASLGYGGKKAYDFAAKKLAGQAGGDTALGSAVGDSVGSTGALDAAIAPSGGVIDLTTAAPGLGAVGVDAAGTAAAGLGADAAAAGTAAAAGVGEAAAGLPWWLGFLGLKDGGVVPRHHFADGGSEDGTDTTDQSTGLLPAGFGDAAKKTLSSSDFWVPAVAGIGSMLASPNKRLLGAIGSGLVGGAEAYKGQQQMALNQQKNALETAKYMATSFTKFIDPDTRQVMWRGPNGVISDAQHNALLGQAATTFGQAGPASNVAGVLRGAPQAAAPQLNAPIVDRANETTTVPGGTPVARAVETAKTVAPVVAPTISTEGRGAPAVKAAPASPVTPPSPAAAAAAPIITGEEQIASPNDRPTELKAKVEKLTQAIDEAQHQGIAAAELAPLVTQRQQLQERADAIVNGTVIPFDKNGQPVTTFKDAANQRTQDASLTDAIGKNKGEYYKNAASFLESYPQDKQLIKSAATVYRSINMNRATGDMADAVGYLRSIPGLQALIPESLATMQGGYDEATKNGVMQAFGQMASVQGEKAPKAIMSEALQTIATPSKAPEARMALLAQKSGQMDRQNEMYADWISAGKPDPAQFALGWNKDPAHDPEKYIEKAQKEIGVFKGAAPLAGNPPLPGQGATSIRQIAQPSQSHADYLRNYVAQNPAAKEKAIVEFDKRYGAGAANTALGVK